MNSKTNKIIRILTIPPFVVSLLLVTLIINGTINTFLDGLLLMLFLGIIPVLSYPLNKLLKGDRSKERKLAFIVTFISYLMGFIYSLVFVDSEAIKFIYYVYFLSIIFLFILNIFFTKASGHMAGVSGLMFVSLHNISPLTLIYTLPIYVITYISSKSLKRHTSKELIFGTLAIVLSYIITLVIV